MENMHVRFYDTRLISLAHKCTSMRVCIVSLVKALPKIIACATLLPRQELILIIRRGGSGSYLLDCVRHRGQGRRGNMRNERHVDTRLKRARCHQVRRWRARRGPCPSKHVPVLPWLELCIPIKVYASKVIYIIHTSIEPLEWRADKFQRRMWLLHGT